MRVKTQITCRSPLLCNKFTDAAGLSAGTSSAIVSGNKGLPRQQAEKKLYLDSKDRPVIPGPNVFKSLIEAGGFHKVGRMKITTMKSSLLPAGLVLEEIEMPIEGPKGIQPKWEVDSRSVVNPSTGGRMMCHRPRFDSWSLCFTLDIDETMFHPDLIRSIVDDAGKKVGLGDFRPFRKGPFGKFTVTSWQPQI